MPNIRLTWRRRKILANMIMVLAIASAMREALRVVKLQVRIATIVSAYD